MAPSKADKYWNAAATQESLDSLLHERKVATKLHHQRKKKPRCANYDTCGFLCTGLELNYCCLTCKENGGSSHPDEHHKNCWNELVQSVENAKLQMRKPLEPEKENADLQHLPPPPTLIKQSLAASKPRRYSQQIESRLRNSFGHMAIEEGNEASSPANSPQKRPQPIAE